MGVLDKAAVLLEILESGPASLVELVAYSGMSRPTTHRIAVAMERLGLLTRDVQGRFMLGPRLGMLAVEVRHDRLAEVAGPVLAELAARTGLAARLYRRRRALQICVGSSVDAFDGIDAAGCDPAAVGTARPASAGPGAQVLYAWAEPEELYEGLRHARFTPAQLAVVRRRCWAYGPDPIAPRAVSYAVPVRAASGAVAEALVLTGSGARMPEAPDRQLSRAAADAAASLNDALLRGTGELSPAGRVGS
ncbi:helix-turn-helix domain-containing protein [Streptomyces sp. NBC_00503]|uniref:helix-turn-helix domain-containing protein n=1 Tax=Streptomyces sp. NBC_00503 TaxID=2903659 RepID=UPI002E7FF951|nr:helix-turn-helix domain-containing protein [Streptomyces sp. NBC_00503]WUD86346.1 helix-turn-helix domain-containing protein [Streptomyces sp. NBC_00503]